MRNKVLIWDLRFTLNNVGGPAGYLFNINTYLNSHPNDEIVFATSLSKKDKKFEILNTQNNYLIKTLKKITILVYLYHIYTLYKVFNSAFKRSEITNIQIADYTYIHFHSIIDLYNSRNILKKYSGKVLLTTHTPEPLAHELISLLWSNSPKFFSFLFKNYIINKEIYAFNRADYLIFPTEFSIEPYFVEEKIKHCLKNLKNKIYFNPSSIITKDIQKQNIKFYHSLCSIPQDAFTLVYIGRHNTVKGYDQLKKIATNLFETFPNLYIVVAGQLGPLEQLNHSRWVELGWSNLVNEIIINADAFILPNKETYFDLIALEVLRAGTPLILSKTGGNKFFNKFDNKPGIFSYDYDNINDVIRIIYNLIELKETNQIDLLRTSNKKIFLSFFTMEMFIKRYMVILNEISKK